MPTQGTEEMKPEIRKELYEESSGPGQSVVRSQSYVGAGMRRVESRFIQLESDHSDDNARRSSEDNGRTWSEWEGFQNALYRMQGADELATSNMVPAFSRSFNPIHGHLVGVYQHTVFVNGHREAFRVFWREGKAGFVNHAFLHVSDDDGETWHAPQLVKFEDGADFDDRDWRSPGFLQNNRAQAASNSEIEVQENGDILFPLCADVTSCCKALGLDVGEVFPSCPEIMRGLIVMRGTWDAEARHYDLVPSRPVVLNDLQSSRGVNEPALHTLSSGRVICVVRGSNTISEGWRTRIEPGTPGYKWFTFSDDGGATWVAPVPWHYDTGEVLYSSSSIHRFHRSARNGRLYWFGNVSGPAVKGNHPRYPLVMGEVDEVTGFLKKDTCAVVDDRDPAQDHQGLQLSNFEILEDRHTGTIELYMTRLGAFLPDDPWRSHAYRYWIEVPPEGGAP